MGFWEVGGKQRPSRWKLAIARAECLHGIWVGALGRGTASDAHESTGKSEQVLQHAESALPVQNRPISGGVRRSGPDEVLGGILACALGQFGPSPHGELPSRVSIRRSGPNRCWRLRGWPCARWRKELRADRDPTANARSPPDQMDCFSSPAPRWLLGLRNVVLLALLAVYNDALT